MNAKYRAYKHATINFNPQAPLNWTSVEEFKNIPQIIERGEELFENALATTCVEDINHEIPLYYLVAKLNGGQDGNYFKCPVNYIEEGFNKAWKQAIKDEIALEKEMVKDYKDLEPDIKDRIKRLRALYKSL